METIVASRSESGPFSTVFDFAERVDPRALNRRALESLIAAGAFDRLEPHRASLHAGVDLMLNFSQRAQSERSLGQASLFGGDSASALRPPELPAESPWATGWCWRRGPSRSMRRRRRSGGRGTATAPLTQLRLRLGL